jgi:hypothetical protein
MSADDRLTAWQFVAMSLEYKLGVKLFTIKVMLKCLMLNFPKLIVTEHPLLLEKVLRLFISI